MKRIATTLLVAGIMAAPMLAVTPPAAAHVSIGIGISVGVPPPVLPVYAQPIAPGPGYIWTPGYWAWNPAYSDYYWVPGTWIMPPVVGLLWTPGWWGWSEGFYRWHGGYWGSHVGFYGGVNYGFGYFGTGYSGGYWRGRHFYYNRAVNNINVTNIRNVYVDKTVINNVHVNRVSYNGGRGGLAVQPNAQQRGWENQRRYQPTSMQSHQRETAMGNPGQRFNANHGTPSVYATRQAGHFDGAHAMRTAGPATGSDRFNRGNDGFVHAPRGGSVRPAEAGAPRHDDAMASSRYRSQTQGNRNGGWNQQPTMESRHASRHDRAGDVNQSQPTMMAEPRKESRQHGGDNRGWNPQPMNQPRHESRPPQGERHQQGRREEGAKNQGEHDHQHR